MTDYWREKIEYTELALLPEAYLNGLRAKGT